MHLDEIMEEICSRWSLPKNYIDFLNNHKDNIYVNVNESEVGGETFL